MNWDTEIWAPCRLGEAFTLRDLGHEHTQYLYGIKADWMGDRGDAMCVRSPDDLEKEHPQASCLGAGPRPWANCWTYEAKIKIHPPVWCWDMQDDTMFGLDLKPKRNGNRRKVKLDCVMIHKDRPVYRIVVEMPDGNQRQYLESIPVLDPYFAPIWPAADDGTPPTVYVAPEPEQTPEKTEQTTDSPKSADAAILPSLANCPERDTSTDTPDAAAFSAGGIIILAGPPKKLTPDELIVPADQLRRVLEAAMTPDPFDDIRNFARAPEPTALECKADPGQLPQLSDNLRRVLTTSNAADLVAAYKAQADEDAPPSWTGTENRPPGACIGGRTPFSGKYYYYVWFEEPPTEGETHEQKAGP